MLAYRRVALAPAFNGAAFIHDQLGTIASIRPAPLYVNLIAMLLEPEVGGWLMRIDRDWLTANVEHAALSRDHKVSRAEVIEEMVVVLEDLTEDLAESVPELRREKWFYR